MASPSKKKKSQGDEPPRIVNRRARHEYEILDKLEAGVQLRGTEVKSIRDGRITLVEGFGRFDRRTGELWLENVDIAAYPPAGPNNHEPRRPRKLLLHRRQLARLRGALSDPGLTLVPLDCHFRDGRAKIEIALARGKRRVDKRQDMKKRAAERDMRRAMTRKTI